MELTFNVGLAYKLRNLFSTTSWAVLEDRSNSLRCGMQQ